MNILSCDILRKWHGGLENAWKLLCVTSHAQQNYSNCGSMALMSSVCRNDKIKQSCV